jgi:chromosome partitioning protein
MTYDPGSPGALSYLEAARELAVRGVRRSTSTAQGHVEQEGAEG